MEIVARTGSEAYVQLVRELLTGGGTSSPRGFDTREILNVTVTIEDAAEAHVSSTARRFSRRIAATETLQLLAGVSGLEQLDLASGGRFSQFADDGRLRGAYGPRTYQQLRQIVHLLHVQPDTRQAYFTIWNGEEQGTVAHDVACTTGGQFLLRDGQLHLRVNMRSSDVFLGVPYDWIMFSRLQLVIAACLGVKVGSYTHAVGSQHLYERDAARAELIAKNGVEEVVPNDVPPPLISGVSRHLPPERSYQSIVRDAMRLCVGADVTTGARELAWYLTNAPQLPTGQFRLCISCRYVTPTDQMAPTGVCRECCALESHHVG